MSINQQAQPAEWRSAVSNDTLCVVRRQQRVTNSVSPAGGVSRQVANSASADRRLPCRLISKFTPRRHSSEKKLTRLYSHSGPRPAVVRGRSLGRPTRTAT